MNFSKCLASLFCCLFMLASLTSYAQLRVGTSGAVGISETPNSNNTLSIKNTAELNTLNLLSESRSGNAHVRGLYNFVRGANSSTTGILNDVESQVGFGSGIVNKITSSVSASATGVSNNITGNGNKTGFFNWFSISNGTTIGLSNKHLNFQGGIFYGAKTEVKYPTSSTSGEIYGEHISITGPTDGPTAYGVYSFVPHSSDYAGHFTGQVSVNGNLVLTSDERVKQNARNIDGALAIVMQLQPRQYQFREGNRFGRNPEEQHFGFMAQHLEEILPSLVHNITHPAVTEERQVREEEDSGIPIFESMEVYPKQVLKGIRYTDLIAVLTQAMQEQQTQVNALREALPGANLEGQSATEVYNKVLTENKELKAELAAVASSLQTLREEIRELKECTDCYGHNKTLLPDDETREISIYPNPAKNVVNVEFKRASSFTVRVVQANGKVLSEHRSEGTYLAIDTGRWIAGAYIFEVLVEGEQVDRRRVVISR